MIWRVAGRMPSTSLLETMAEKYRRSRAWAEKYRRSRAWGEALPSRATNFDRSMSLCRREDQGPGFT